MNKGRVYLVGAGPGDPGLLTLRGRHILEKADQVIYDSLVPESLLRFAKRAEKISTGPLKEEAAKRQARIHQLLLKGARKGLCVVRLKGGDPFVFGRGAEEALFLHQHKIAFEIVPGVSAGYAVPAYAGIPVTDRRFTSQAVFVTANEDPQKESAAVDWKRLAGLRATLVLFMGVRTLGKVAYELERAGMKSGTPVSVIEWGTLSRQKTVTGTLKNIAKLVRASKIQSPAITVVGGVNQFRKSIAWFEKKPLFGKKIILTRDLTQNADFRFELESEGAEVLECPVIQIAPPLDWRPVDQALEQLNHYDWIVFSSVHGVHHFFQRLTEQGLDARALSRSRIAAIGEVTAEVLKSRGILPDLIPAEYTSEGLIRELRLRDEMMGKRFLLPRTDIAPEYLREELVRAGAVVTQVVIYRTLPVFSAAQKKSVSGLLQNPDAWVVFTSSSTVRNFMEALKPRRSVRAKMISIGPVTSSTIRQYKLKPYKEAREHTIAGLVKVMLGR